MTMNQPKPDENQPGRSRYPGTRPFGDSADDAARFFGRTEEGQQLYLRVLSVPLLVQFGRSGLGKTSLLQAWLFPRLRQKPFLPVMVRINDPGDTLTSAVARSMQQACADEGLDFAAGRSDGLWEFLSTTTVWREDLLLTPVIVFDQFEEVFTLRDAAFRTAIAAELGALASGVAPDRLRAGQAAVPEPFSIAPSVKIIISLREDYLGALQEFSAAIPSLFHERLRLEPLTDEAAREAINGPAQLTAGPAEEPYWSPRFEFEPRALDTMMAYLKGSSGVIEPFQLQLLCRHAEAIAHDKDATNNGSVTLALSDFAGVKGFDSVLKNFYRDTLLKLDIRQQRRAEDLCEEGLLNPAGHRLMLEEGQIRTQFGVKPETLGILSTERLVRRERRNESVFYEISHDRLAESILASRRFRLPKTLKRALWASGAAVLLIVVGLVVWKQSVQKARDRAEGLLSFLLGENFLGEVRDIGRSTMLEQVRTRTEEHLGRDSGRTLNRALALRNRGDLDRTHGLLSQSIASFDEALNILNSGSGDWTNRRETARTHERLGEAVNEQGRVSDALHHYNSAVEAWREVVNGDPQISADDCTRLADALTSSGEIHNRMGEAALALKDLKEAFEITSAVLFGRESGKGCGATADKVQPYPDAQALTSFSRAALLRATILNYESDYEGAVPLAVEAKRLRPSSVSARKDALVALAWRGNGRTFRHPQLALNDYRTGLAQFEELRRWDPSNRLWQRERAANQLLVSEGIVGCHDNKNRDCKPLPPLEEAEATSLEAIATMRALVQMDTTNASLQEDLIWALQSYARVLEAQQRQPERIAVFEEAERIYDKRKGDAVDAERVAILGRLWRYKASALFDMQRLPEAKALVEKAAHLFDGLIAAHKDSLTYITDLLSVRQLETLIHRKLGDASGADAVDREVQRLTAESERFTAPIDDEAKRLNVMHVARVGEGAKLYNANSPAPAVREFKAAESFLRQYIRERPTEFRGYDNLRNLYHWLDLTYAKLDAAKERSAALVAAMHAARIAALLVPEDSSEKMKIKLNEVEARRNFGMFLNDLGGRENLLNALAMVQEQVVVAEDLVEADPANANYVWGLGNAKCGLGVVRRNLNEPGWKEAVSSGLILVRKAAEMDKKNAAYQKEVEMWRNYLAEETEKDAHKLTAVRR